MQLLKAVKQVLYKADLMNSNSLLRIKGEPEHTTLLGGIISIALMIALLSLFYNRIIDTLDKTIITSTSSIKNAADPTPFYLSTFDNSTFMVGVEVDDYDLNGPTRAFDIVLSSTTYKNGV